MQLKKYEKKNKNVKAHGILDDICNYANPIFKWETADNKSHVDYLSKLQSYTTSVLSHLPEVTK